MRRQIGQRIKLFLLALMALPFATTSVRAGDVIDLDLTNVDPSVRHVFLNAEKFWEDRILGYSSQMPRVLTDQLSALQISATVSPIDGVGGVLGFAGPDGTLSYYLTTDRPYVVAVTSSMTFDLDDFPSMEADGILEDVIIHEMGHALGVGSLWQQNQLIGPLNGIGQTEYINGRYAIQGYQRDLGNPTVLYVPLEQRGGAGTALGHWNDMPPFFNQVFTSAFKKEIMTGFACDVNPDTGELVCATKFVSQATLGSLADLGFSTTGFNERFALPRGKGFGPWPKVINGPGPIINFGNSAGAGGLRFNLGRSMMALKESRFSTGSGTTASDDENREDPYNLRKHSWSK